MVVRPVSPDETDFFDKVVTHPLQSFAWGNFRAQTGMAVERIGIFDNGKLQSGYQVTFHDVPHTSYTIGYVPRGSMPDEVMLRSLEDLGRRHNALFIKLEPNISAPMDTPSAHDEVRKFLTSHGCVEGKSLFTPYTFILSLTPSEDELLANMHQKTRYNINVAKKKGVKVIEESTDEALEEYIKLLEETTKRQQFYAHSSDYFRKMWKEMHGAGIAHIFKAIFEGKTLGIWIVFSFNNVLYYPYGASSRENREVMANNLLAWEVIRFGKASGATSFDMWGSLGQDPNPKDPWYGFHKFKEGYGGKLTHFVGTFDYVLNPTMYSIFQKIDSLRWKYLRLRKALGL